MRSLEDMLEHSPWTAALSPSELARVRSDMVVRDFAPGAPVCRKLERADCWVGVIDGLVKLNAHSASGKSATFAGVPAGSWFGEGSVLKREPRRYDVVALRESRIAFMPEATFHWLLDGSIPFNRFLLDQLNERLAYFIGMLEHDRLLGPDARVARSLASLFDPLLYPGTRTSLAISQEEIGHLAGLSRQRSNQALKTLEKAGLIRIEYAGITVLDLPRLRSFEDA